LKLSLCGRLSAFHPIPGYNNLGTVYYPSVTMKAVPVASMDF